MRYIKQIDGLRFIAIIGVLLFSYFQNTFLADLPFGYGVNLFFVISGYLITHLLISERNNTEFSFGRSLKNFYARRALRIIPAYYILLIILIAIKFQNYQEISPWAFSFTENVYASLNMPYAGSYNHFWSLAVEMQFYLVWPFLFFFTKNPRIIGKIIYVTIGASLLFKIIFFIVNGGWAVAMNGLTIGCLDSFGLGALVAYWNIYRPEKIAYYTSNKRFFLLFSAFLFILLDFFPMFSYFGWIRQIFSNSLFSLFAFFLLIPASRNQYTGGMKRFLENKLVTHIGKISYGLYLYHLFMPDLYNYLCDLNWFQRDNNATRWTFYFVALFLVAELSWFIIERPINRLKKYFSISPLLFSKEVIVAAAKNKFSLLRNSFPKSSFKPSFAILLVIALFIIMTESQWRFWKKGETPFIYDMDQYYSYLPAAFIHHDLSFKYTDKYWLATAKNGGSVAKGTYGIALMEAPFFFLGYKVAINTQAPLDGYSEPFKEFVHYGSLLYVFLGLFALRQILIRFFNEWISALTLVAVFFCTNYFNYSLVESEMAHSYLFFLIACFLLLSIKWYENPKLKVSILLGFVFGLLTLIRPTEIVLILVFVGFGVVNRETLKKRMHVLWDHKVQLIGIGIAAFLVWLPQMIYWKTYTDQYLFFSYGSEEGFFFSDPKITSVLLGYRKGWLLYTPIMLFALLGFFLLRGKAKKFMYVTPLYFLINLYLISSWWCWWYGGSFGMRALIHVYPLLAIPLAGFFTFIFTMEVRKALKTVINYATFGLVFFCLVLNLMQTIQYKNGVIHYYAMTKEAYWITFGKLELDYNDKEAWAKALKDPDYKEALKGKRDE